MIKFMADNGEAITCAQDAALYDLIGDSNDYIIDDVGDKMRVDYNAASLTVTVNSGEAVICGRHVSIEGTETVELPASSSFYLVIRYDTRETGSDVVKIVTTDSKYEGYLNNPSYQSVEDMILAYITTSASGVSNFDDRRVFFSDISSNRGGRTLYGTSEPTIDLGNDGDSYIQYEE